jgi:hypothetical protein
MKKFLLTTLGILVATWSFAQTVFYVQNTALEGSYNMTYVGQAEGTTDWGSPNMDDPANALDGVELALAFDGTEADSLLCDETGGVINGEDIAGKMAVCYRGGCFFSLKAVLAQEAGALGLVIINNQGDPIEMGGGDFGPNVTIPVVMISTNDGATLRPAIEAGGLTVFFGNKLGFYENDMGLTAATVLRAENFSQPRALATSGDDFTVPVEAQLINYGVNTQTNVALKAEIVKDGVTLYDETSDAVLAMANGDTSNFVLPSFSQEPYEEGLYHVYYSVVYGEDDEFPADNMYDAAFMISDSLYSYARIDAETGQPFNITGTRPSAAVDEVRQCLEFQHPNASLVEVEGMTFAAGTLGETLIGEAVDVYVYQWEAEFEDLDDPNYELSDDVLTDLTFGSYEYLEELDNENIYVPFEDVVTLQDNVRYLFCVSYLGADLLISHDSRLMDYNRNLEFFNQPIFPLYNETEASWFAAGFGTETVPAFTVKIVDPTFDDVSENAQKIQLDAYPNPTADFVNINIPENIGEATLVLYDVTGKQIQNLNSTLAQGGVIRLDLSDLENGAYICNLTFENGSYSNVNIVVAR